MGVRFDNKDTQRKARMLAEHRGVTEEFAIDELLRRELEREGLVPSQNEGARRAAMMLAQAKARMTPEELRRHEQRFSEFMRVLEGVQRGIAELPDADPRSIEEIMRDVYDEDGLPK